MRDREALRKELQALEHAGKIEAREAVEWARAHPKSALYDALEWDDAHAAEEYRVWQVRQLIAIVILDEDGGRDTVSLSIDRRDGGGYRQIKDVVKAPQLREIMLRDALAELNRVRKKYARLTELVKVWEEVDRVESRSSKRRAPNQAPVRKAA